MCNVFMSLSKIAQVEAWSDGRGILQEVAYSEITEQTEVIRDGFVQDTWNANLERARVIPSHYNSTRLVCGMLSSVGDSATRKLVKLVDEDATLARKIIEIFLHTSCNT